MERITLAVGGDAREYLLFVPARQPRPLVIFLHGAGGTAAWADGETGWSALAEREGFALALPEAIPPHRGQPPKFLTNPQRWNDGGTNSAGGISTADDVGFLAALIGDAAARAGIDPNRVYVSGFSNGAAMAFRAAADLADRVAAIAPVAGYLRVADPRPARPVPTLFMIGSADPLVPPRGGEVRSPWRHRYVRRPPIGETLERWAVAIGCDPVPVVESDADGVRVECYPGPVPFRSVLIDGLGHHWPGGQGLLNHKIGGPPSDRIDGTAHVWRFLRAHCLSS